MKRLTAEEAVEIRVRRARGESPTELAVAFGVTDSFVAAVCLGKKWRSAGGPLTRSRNRGDLGSRLASLTDRSAGDAGCWLWLGSKDGHGYGRLHFRGRVQPAHRLALELAIGRALAVGEVTRHAKGCPRCCVNPRHLQPGTMADNNRDMAEHGTLAVGSRNGIAKLTEAEVRAIRAASETHGEIARRFHIDPSNVSYIRSGKAWRHVDDGAVR